MYNIIIGSESHWQRLNCKKRNAGMLPSFPGCLQILEILEKFWNLKGILETMEKSWNFTENPGKNIVSFLYCEKVNCNVF
jgi:hypothetical protein